MKPDKQQPFKPPYPMPKLIETHALTFSYYTENKEEILALDHIDFTLNQGEHIAIIGENGAGKSTFLQVMRGEIYPSPKNGGKIYWYENGSPSVAPLSAREMCAIISPKEQDYYARQDWNVNCLEIVLAACSNDYILYREPSTKEVLQAVEIAKQLGAEYLLYTPINKLSQGQLRIMLIARALMKKSPVILLDEPLNGLDEKTQQLFWQTLEKLAACKLDHKPTIVLTTHLFPLPPFIKHCYEMKQGRLSLIDNDNQSELLKIAEQYRQIPKEHVEKKQDQAMEIILENASIYLDHTEIVKHINWHIQPKEQWTLIGHNGSGKSTLLNGILGFLPIAVGGSITRNWYQNLQAQPVPLTVLDNIKEKIHFVSDTLQTHYTFNDTVTDVIFAGFDGNIGVYRDKTEEEIQKIQELLHQLNLVHLATRPFRSLSTGQARKVLLARAIIGDPALLLLDEPFSGLDPRNKQEIKEFLEYKIAETSLQTILVSHLESDYLSCSTNFGTMFKGEFSVLD